MSTSQITDGVYRIDIELFDSGFSSVYLFDDEEPTLIDAGTATSADSIKKGLTDCGVDPSDLQHLVLSHIHVDHSGAASALVDAAPDLNVYIHEMTASHLTDPDTLIESSKRAMGDYFDLIGEQDPVPEENVIPVSNDGTTIDIGTNTLEMLYAPGHSPDHFAVWDPEREFLFAAECLGLYLPRADRWLPPATLPNFDVDQIADTIDHLRTLDPEHIAFLHSGTWPREPAAAFDLAERELHRFDERILDLHEATNSREATKQAVATELVDVSPPYDDRVESFIASLITDGYLKHHGIE
ncbi:MBL fold metallo-hydrolase [Haloglomus litoreum]|uniref:MBL fold metallo-hydrolase n=1 Tax=Haloglomus litoreum TaxID=3034026 RepID=UPI0023E879FD|nr:MBL fold metallo-hydrolase [Haloglomus sp. DT116]